MQPISVPMQANYPICQEDTLENNLETAGVKGESRLMHKQVFAYRMCMCWRLHNGIIRIFLKNPKNYLWNLEIYASAAGSSDSEHAEVTQRTQRGIGKNAGFNNLRTLCALCASLCPLLALIREKRFINFRKKT